MLKYFIISDIHAHYNLLIEALKNARFNIDNKEHILIIAGDILDRGKQGEDVICFLEKLIIQKRIKAVLGNHDLFLKDILNNEYNISNIKFNVIHNGFGETLKLIFDLNNHRINVKNINLFRKLFIKKYSDFSDWLVKLPIYLEFSNHVIVHAFLDFSLDDWRNTTTKYAVWSRNFDEDIPDTFYKKLIFGHTPNIYINGYDDVIYGNSKIMIDGGAALDHKINILCLNENSI